MKFKSAIHIKDISSRAKAHEPLHYVTLDRHASLSSSSKTRDLCVGNEGRTNDFITHAVAQDAHRLRRCRELAERRKEVIHYLLFTSVVSFILNIVLWLCL